MYEDHVLKYINLYIKYIYSTVSYVIKYAPGFSFFNSTRVFAPKSCLDKTDALFCMTSPYHHKSSEKLSLAINFFCYGFNDIKTNIYISFTDSLTDHRFVPFKS